MAGAPSASTACAYDPLSASSTAARLDRLLPGAETADQFAHRVHAVRLEVVGDAGIDLPARKRLVEQRRAHADGRRAGDDEFECVLRAADATLADDRHPVRARDL